MNIQLTNMTKQEQINAIYKAYPRKVGSLVAKKAIEKALKLQSFDSLLEKTSAYAEAITWQDRQFIPHPSTWFNQGRYDDDPIEWRDPDQGLKPMGGRKLNNEEGF